MRERVIIVGLVLALLVVGGYAVAQRPMSASSGKPAPAKREIKGVYGVADAIEQLNILPDSAQPYDGALYITQESGESVKVQWWGYECKGLRDMSNEDVQMFADSVRNRDWVEVSFREPQPGVKCLINYAIFNR